MVLPGIPEGLGERAVPKDPFERCREPLCVSRPHQEASLFMSDQRGHAADGRCYYGTPQREGFGERERQALTYGRQHHGVRGLHQIEHPLVVHRPHQADVAAQSSALDFGFQNGSEGPASSTHDHWRA